MKQTIHDSKARCQALGAWVSSLGRRNGLKFQFEVKGPHRDGTVTLRFTSSESFIGGRTAVLLASDQAWMLQHELRLLDRQLDVTIVEEKQLRFALPELDMYST